MLSEDYLLLKGLSCEEGYSCFRLALGDLLSLERFERKGKVGHPLFLRISLPDQVRLAFLL